MNTHSDNENKVLSAAKLFENGTLTISQAAKSCGHSISDFMNLLKRYDVSVFNYPATDLESDVKNARESIDPKLLKRKYFK